MINRYVKIGLSVAVIVALAVGGIKAVKNAKAKDAATPKAKIYPIVVSSLSPKIQEVQLTLPFLSIVANDKDVQLSSRIAARILKIKPSGSSVKKGEIIISLDTTTIRSSLQSVKEQLYAAKIALKNLKATHGRTLELLKVQGASIEESQKEDNLIANAKAGVVGLRQKEIELKNNLSYATITSPVNGLISKIFANRGSVSMPGKPLVSISAKNGFYLMVRAPRELPIEGVVYDDKTYEATPLRSTYHGLSEYKVYTGSDNLISGDRVEVDVIVFKQNATLLPFDALLNRDGKSFVLVINGNTAKAQEVHIVQSAEQGVVIHESLEGKNIVIAKPDILLRLTSGYALKVKK